MKWWIDEKRVKSITPSAAEIRIIKAFKSARIKHFREVCFKGCNSIKGYSLKFDFYIPHKNLLLEYDGIQHEKKSAKENDDLKTKFAKRKGLILIRLNRKKWRSLERTVLNIIKKTPDKFPKKIRL